MSEFDKLFNEHVAGADPAAGTDTTSEAFLVPSDEYRTMKSRIAELEKQLEEHKDCAYEVNLLVEMIMGDADKRDIDSQAFTIGHYQCVLNARAMNDS